MTGTRQAPTPTPHEDAHVVTVEGDLDLHTAPEVRERVSAALEAGALRLVIDLERVRFLDSSGVGVLLDALKRVRGIGGALAVACRAPNALRVLELTGVDHLLPVVATRAEALDAVR